jgi:anti-sigma28 factor (negative regulator of flagellin synthesis)
MRINTGDTKDASQVDLNQAQATRDASVAADPRTSANRSSIGPDSIALTGASDLVQMILNSGTDARSLRAAQLKQQIDSNSYAMDPAAVSRALVDDHLTD